MNTNYLILFTFFMSILTSFSSIRIDLTGEDTFISQENPYKIMNKDEFFKNILICGSENYISYVKPNYGQIQELILNEEDIVNFKFKFYVLWMEKPTNLYFYRIVEKWDENVSWAEGNIKFEKIPFLTYKVERIGWHEISLNKVFKEIEFGFALKSEYQIRIVSLDGEGSFRKERASFEIEVKEYPKYQLWDFDIVPVEGIYVKVKNGHLYYGNKRLRLWGVCRHDSRRLETVQRIKKMGFNAVRLWGPQNAYDEESIKKGEFTKLKFEEEPVDLDSFDRFFYELKREGLFIWCVSLHYIKLTPKLWKSLLSDNSFIAGGDDWKEWKNAVTEIIDTNKYEILRYFLYFDERISKLYFQHAKNFLLHQNPYTRKKYAEEEAICIFEIQNENGFIKWVLERGFDNWPIYFKEKLKRKWNKFLIWKYKNTENLKKEWGELEPRENLEEMSVNLAPIFSERYIYPKKRGEDFIEFLSNMIIEFNHKFENYCRSFAPMGIGVNVIPFVYDTLFRLNNAWLYINSNADINSFGIYFWKLSSSLTVPPSLYVIDSTTIYGKPNLIYEINTSRPNPYRSEDPFRIVALASLQDWDGIFWHYWNELEPPGRNFIPDEQYLISPLPLMTETWADGGITHASDPVMCSSLSIAGHIFRKFLISPATKPTIYEVGKEGIFNYDYFRGISTRKDSFTTGAKIKFNLEQNEPLKIQKGENTNKEIKYEWEKGRMIIDNDKVIGYIGFWENNFYKFSNDFAILNVSSPFASIVLTSKDGNKLKESKEFFLTALWDVKNSGFEMDMKVAREGGGFVGPSEQARAIIKRGKPPVIMDKIKFDIYFPFSIYGRIEFYDFALRKFAEIKLNGENIINISPQKNYYMIKFIIDKKDKIKTSLPLYQEKIKIERKTTKHKPEFLKKREEFINLWCPVKELNWAMDYAQTHQILRDSTLIFTTISPFDSSEKIEKKIILTDFEIWNCVADMEILFKDNFMESIFFTFKEIPSFDYLIEVLKKELGEPKEKRIEQVAFQENYVIWNLKEKGKLLNIELKEFQGSIFLKFFLKSQ